MKRNIYKLQAWKNSMSLALALIGCSGTAYSQATYTFNYTGGVQTLTVPAGVWQIECWGATGGSITGVGGGGLGGYSIGEINSATSVSLNILVGGKGGAASGILSGPPGAGGWNGGGGGSMIGVAGCGGGGATDVRVGGLAASNRIIVAGGGGGAAGYYTQTPLNLIANGGNGGGLIGANGNTITSGGVITVGGGGQGATAASPGIASVGGNANGTATGGGGGAYSANGASAGGQGIGGGAGGAAGPSGGGSTGCASGGGGGYAGGAGGVQNNNGGAAGGGGSGYVGGVTNGTTVAFGQAGYVNKPGTSADGLVIIKELCNFSLYAAGNTNSLMPMLCSGQSATLMTNAISNYSWSTGATSSSLVVSPTSNTVYVLTATSPSNCTTTRQISVNVNGAPPVLSITQSTPGTCLGNTVTVNATGAISYTWSHGVTSNVPFAPSATAVYTVQGQNGCGITQGTATINIAPLPVVGVASPSVICENELMQLSATGATTYTWLPTNQTGSLLASSASVTTIFTVTGQSGACTGQHMFSVVTKPNPTITVAGTSTRVCLGSPVTLTVSGANTYTWVQNLSGNVVTDHPTAPTFYQVSGTNSVNCTSTGYYVMVVDQPPTLSTNLTTTTICMGDQAMLDVSGADSYTWSTGANTASLMASPSSFSVYTVTGAHNSNTCTSVEQFTVNPVTAFLEVSTSTAICIGAQITLTAGAGQDINWNPGGPVPMLINISPTSTTVYTVTAIVNTVNINCPASNMVTVTVNPKPSVTANASQPSVCRNDIVTLNAQGAQTYSWSTGDTGQSITYSSGSSGSKNIMVEGTDNNGCKSTAFVMLQVTPCSGLSEWTNSDVLIYPNPSNGAFVIKGNKTMNVVVYNALGQPLKSAKMNASDLLEMHDLTGGIYFVSIDDGSTTTVKSVVVQR